MRKYFLLATFLSLILLANSQVTTYPVESGDSLFKITVEKIKKKAVVNPAPQDPQEPAPGEYGTLTYSTGFDQASDINTNQGPKNSISTKNFVTGPGSFRSEAGANTSASSGYRGEMQYNDAKQNPTEGVWEYDVYYEDWKAFAGGGHSMQWHPNSSGGSAVLSLQNYGGYFNVVRSLGGKNFHQQGDLKQVIPNKWYRMRWEIKFSTGSDGYIRLYLDNVEYYRFAGITSSGGQYVKVGQNRWSTTGGAPSGPNTVVYYDNFKVYKK